MTAVHLNKCVILGRNGEDNSLLWKGGTSSTKGSHLESVCRAMKDLDETTDIKCFRIDSSILGEYALVQMVQNLPRVKWFRVCIEWNILSNQSKRAMMVEGITNIHFENITIQLVGGNYMVLMTLEDRIALLRNRIAARADNAGAARVRNEQAARLEDGEPPVAALCRVDNISHLTLSNLDLTVDDCRSLAELLASRGCTIKRLSITGNLPENDGLLLIVNAFAHNKSLKVLSLEGFFTNEGYQNVLLGSPPANKSIETLTFGTATEDYDVGAEATAAPYIQCRPFEEHRSPKPEGKINTFTLSAFGYFLDTCTMLITMRSASS